MLLGLVAFGTTLGVLVVRIFFFPDSTYGTWQTLLVLAPATEEPLKLFFAFMVATVWNLGTGVASRSPPGTQPERGVRTTFALVIFVLVGGLAFGAREHVNMFPGEDPSQLLARLFAHPAGTMTAFGGRLLVWRRVEHPAFGVWAGGLCGMVPHAVFNLGAAAPAAWPWVHGTSYTLPVSGLCFLGGLGLLLHLLKQEPASDSALLLATGEVRLAQVEP